MLGRREFLAIAVTLLVTIGNEGCQGQSDESSSDCVHNEIDLVPTKISAGEKTLQAFLSAVSGGSSSSSSSESGSGGIGRFLDSVIPNPIKEIISSNKTAMGRGFGDVLNLVGKQFGAIFPGTRWCGGGNIASNEEDLGLFERTDACCRAHDNCPSNISAGKTLGRLINNGIFTRSACTCDEEFYKCLQATKSLVSLKIGKTYFNLLKPQCFREEYPIIKCEEYANTHPFEFEVKCDRYSFNYSKKKILQWFDNPDFRISRNTSHPN